MKCYGRFSGTEDGWMLFEDASGCVWEEKANEWEEVIVLNQGFFYYRNKQTGLIAEGAQ